MRPLALIFLLATHLLAINLLVGALLPRPVSAQALAVSDALTGDTELVAAVGDTLTIQIRAELGALPAAGIALYLSVPAHGLSWLSLAEGSAAERPFQAGGLFAGAIEFTNKALPIDQSWGQADNAVLLSYAVVIGPGAAVDRARSGAGVVATLRAVCTAPIEAGHIAIFDNAIHQTRVVLADGRTELGAVAAGSLQLSTTPDTDIAARTTAGSWGQLKQLSRRD